MHNDSQICSSGYYDHGHMMVNSSCVPLGTSGGGHLVLFYGHFWGSRCRMRVGLLRD
ncbi:hypothetical protein SCLCIDRAFT_1215552 [Scleroderma citrinum Foug A]|uniref:Uncharacterized protein n=1 Tax=Scleroderma citrinum Foug A TaxID=1036808 RepID=A0A0C3E1G5_9AGAM|nr:hypothetical protein SCLCIDRAFT_1215552 [Scleroderma citrinum Foug A]